ncbi:MAG: dehydrogenase E1 component subunit alpha/beta [Bacteroidetes bacterium]|nr:dehydrogenase E1 component subunit alpha/beta [Bacteroidota bacterium]
MKYDRKDLSNDELIRLYKLILKPRVIEERMLKLLRQGRVSKWFSGIGQEGIAVGVTAALHSDEYVCPLHRNLGVFTARNCDLQQLFEQFQGKAGGFSQGRERSFHFGTNEHHIVGMISHLGPQLCVADGIALANKLRQEKKITVAFTGDGGTSEGDFHEACNIAAVWDLPVILLIENNGYGLSTPTNEQFRCKYLAERAVGYGMKGITIDGNNILEVYHTVKALAEDMRENPKPVLLECMTFRMRGHEEASGVKYVPKELFEIWEKKDPVTNYENWLIEEGIISPDFPLMLKEEMDLEVRAAFDAADKQPDVVPSTKKEVEEVYMTTDGGQQTTANTNATTSLRLVDAVREGLMQSMQQHDNLVVMGQDVAEYGGVFKVTEGFVEMFGKERVRNTPLCESGILSAALGMSVKGMKSVVEMQFADFVSTGFNAIVNNLAKSYWRWGQNADVVVRMPTGAGVGAGPFHSQSNEAWFFHTPGLKVVYPSTPADAKGLLCASINDPNPVMFFEHKALYRGVEGDVPNDYYTIEIGKANVVQAGDELSIITYGSGVHWALDTTKGTGVEVLDLRTLLPFDKEAIEATVKKTGKVLVLHEDTLTGGIGAEIAAWITEHLFEHLDAPVMRLASLDTPVPFAIPLEKNFLPKDRLKEKVEALLNY